MESEQFLDRHSDWPPLERLSSEAREQVEVAFEAALKIIGELPNAGFAMRGMSMAIAASYQPVDLERGAQSTIRGVRNAFADRKMETF